MTHTWSSSAVFKECTYHLLYIKFLDFQVTREESALVLFLLKSRRTSVRTESETKYSPEIWFVMESWPLIYPHSIRRMCFKTEWILFPECIHTVLCLFGQSSEHAHGGYMPIQMSSGLCGSHIHKTKPSWYEPQPWPVSLHKPVSINQYSILQQQCCLSLKQPQGHNYSELQRCIIV